VRVAAQGPPHQLLRLRLRVLHQPPDELRRAGAVQGGRGGGLVLDFYRRNYIEGLFLSSGIIRSSDYTMEQLVLVARRCAATTASAATST
jgi:hypothetical protein